MISGREPNILRCMPPEERDELLAQQRKAEAKLAAKSEKTEQLIFNKWLKEHRKAGRLYFINPRSDKASTIECGHPDYTIWIKGQPTLFIEMKALGGELSGEQIEVIAELQDLGQHVYVAWNHLQAQSIVEFYLSVLVSTTQSNDKPNLPRTQHTSQAELG